ncbi:hypothetical protein CQA66_00385 [Helicobacter aurati]|uniref:Modification methylase n=1 Tax=Helicobacter aurati TaxID=137778 RepID=A0A3D8J9V9_9HELI|nr:adenine-specific methyltransferase EcoRI family protein [Helicobacter aurati]RDU73681.1 hypothetical protein CQA66_00385 [Helicobacter aurati]
MSRVNNTNLHEARVNKKDEFYTQLSDIENELKHYKQHFKDKIVLCNCDDPEYSNFHRYFRLNFLELGLKKLITTHYKGDGGASYANILTREMVEKDRDYINLSVFDKSVVCGSQTTKHETRNTKHETRNTKHETRNIARR